MRHARASSEEHGGTDHERELDDHGVRSVSAMAARMVQMSLVPQWVLASSSRRTVQTAEGLIKSWPSSENGPIRIERCQNLYLAEGSAYLHVLVQVPWDVSHVLVVGHNPGLSDLVSELCSDARTMSTAAVASFLFDAEKIADISARTPRRMTDWFSPEKL